MRIGPFESMRQAEAYREQFERSEGMNTFVVRRPETTDEALSRTLACVRPWSLMVVVAGEASYLDDILRSFR